MAFNTDYASFRTAVGSWIDVSDLSSGQLDDIITNAEKRIERGDGPQEPGLRVREMETAFAWTITGTGVISLPSDYLEMKNAYLDASPVVKLQRANTDMIYRQYPYRTTGQAKPMFYAREANNLIFGPAPDSEYVVKGVYYKKLASMASDATINGVFTAYPDLFLKGAVLEAEKVLGRDERTRVWEPDFRRQLQSANYQGQQEEFSGSDLSVRVNGPTL